MFPLTGERMSLAPPFEGWQMPGYVVTLPGHSLGTRFSIISFLPDLLILSNVETVNGLFLVGAGSVVEHAVLGSPLNVLFAFRELKESTWVKT